MAPKSVTVRVISMDSEFQLIVPTDAIGKQLFTQVVQKIGVSEIWYFGLQYIDSKNVVSWLKLDRKILAHDFSKTGSQPMTFHFLARFYPEEVSTELIEEITQKLFFLQVKKSILSDEIFCPAETCVLLASYAMQAKYGDFNEQLYHPDLFRNVQLLPRRVKDQYRLPDTEWEKRIINWWKEHQGLMQEDARMEYLKVAQDLEMYGVSYYEIRNKKKTQLCLGIDALGLNIYDPRDKLIPKIGFPWSEIGNISYENKKFIIKPMEKKSPNFVFLVERRRINRQILSLCKGNHELYMRRRKADSNEIQMMKVEARRRKEIRRQQYERERGRRIAEDQERNFLPTAPLEKALDDIRKKSVSRETSISSDSESIQEQRIVSRASEDELRRVQEAERRTEDERERLRLAREQSANDARREQEERNRSIVEEQKRINHNEKIDAPEELKHQITDPEDTDDDEDDDEGNYEKAVPLETNPNVPRPEETRSSVINQDQTIKSRLQATRKELEKQHIQQETHEEKIYRENIIDKGIDKYKTLKKIREGTVKRRIDEFEAM